MAARLDRGFVVDTSLAAVFVAYAEVDVWLRRGVVPGQKAVAAVGLGLMTMSLAWRRRAPLLTCLVSGAALAVESIAAGGAPEGGVVLLPVLLLMFSVAAYEHRVRAVVGAALLLVAVLIQSVQDPKIVGTASLVLVDGFFFGILGVGSWALGRFVKRRREVEGTLSSKAATWQQLHEVEQVLIADERQQIARELHDVVAHTVSVMGVQAAAADQIMDGDPQRAREALSTIQDTARDAVNELRRLLTVLRAGESTPDLAPQPALRDLARLADLTRASGLDVDLTMPAPLPVLPLGIELAAYRIVQESLTNVRKHANARRVCVRLSCSSGFLIIDVDDDGAGLTAAPVNGHGLIGMRERATLYGGTFTAGPRPDSGFAVRAMLPLEITTA